MTSKGRATDTQIRLTISQGYQDQTAELWQALEKFKDPRTLIKSGLGFAKGVIQMDWNAIAAVAGWVAAVAAIATLWWQQWQSNFSTHLDYLWRLQDQFNGPEMAAKRAIAAAQLLDGNTKENPKTDAILDFFDLVGYIVQQKALDKEAAWMMFSDAGCSYWYGAEPYIKAANLKNPLYWEHFKPLIDAFISIEMSKGGIKSRTDAEARARVRSADFLQEERNLSLAGRTQATATSASGRVALARVDVPVPTPTSPPS